MALHDDPNFTSKIKPSYVADFRRGAVDIRRVVRDSTYADILRLLTTENANATELSTNWGISLARANQIFSLRDAAATFITSLNNFISGF